ncbi:hypothetical protein D3C77_266870 [compost metagenome]
MTVEAENVSAFLAQNSEGFLNAITIQRAAKLIDSKLADDRNRSGFTSLAKRNSHLLQIIEGLK